MLWNSNIGENIHVGQMVAYKLMKNLNPKIEGNAMSQFDCKRQTDWPLQGTRVWPQLLPRTCRRHKKGHMYIQ